MPLVQGFIYFLIFGPIQRIMALQIKATMAARHGECGATSRPSSNISIMNVERPIASAYGPVRKDAFTLPPTLKSADTLIGATDTNNVDIYPTLDVTEYSSIPQRRTRAIASVPRNQVPDFANSDWLSSIRR